MKVTVKNIKNEMFEIDVEPTNTIGEVKQIINNVRADYVPDRLRVIYQGKVLENASTVAASGLKEKDTLVCIASAAKPAAATATTTTTSSSSGATATSASAPAPAANSSSAPSVPAATVPQPASAPTNPNPGAVADLMAMTGASEAMVNECLIAAMGDPNRAFDFLMGAAPMPRAPPSRQATATTTPASSSTPPPSTPAGPLDKLRRHPQFRQLQQLCQSNPAAIPQVLKIVGDQDPELLTAIHANLDAFTAMMNEPIGAGAPAQAAPSQAPRQQGGMPGMGMDAGGMDPLAGLAQMPAAQRAMMAQQMGIPPQQLEQVLQMMSAMSPEQRAALQQQALQQGGVGGMGGVPGANRPGTIQVQMSPQDMENVRQIQALTGASQDEIVQIYISCDRDVDQTASIILSNSETGGGYEFEGGDNGQGPDDDDDMYG